MGIASLKSFKVNAQYAQKSERDRKTMRYTGEKTHLRLLFDRIQIPVQRVEVLPQQAKEDKTQEQASGDAAEP